MKIRYNPTVNVTDIVLIVGGIYLMTHGHDVAGGWLIAAAILV